MEPKSKLSRDKAYLAATASTQLAGILSTLGIMDIHAAALALRGALEKGSKDGATAVLITLRNMQTEIKAIMDAGKVAQHTAYEQGYKQARHIGQKQGGGK